jgi:hypothetical protein
MGNIHYVNTRAEWFGIVFHKYLNIFHDHKQVKKCQYALVWRCQYFYLHPIKTDTCCKFLGPGRPHIHVNMSIVVQAVFLTLVVEDRYVFAAVATGFSTTRRK